MNVDIQKKHEHIQQDLQSMQQSLESLKQSLDQDVALTTKKECVSLLKDIVNQMAHIDSSQHMIDLQKKLEWSNILSGEILQEILQSFIALKLSYTESIVDSQAEHLIERYSWLVTKKSELDTLLASFEKSKSYQIDPNANQDVASDDWNDSDNSSNLEKEDWWLMRNTKAIFSKEEWQRDWQGNALRTASWLAIVWGAVWWVKKLWSRMSGGDSEKSKDKSSEKKEGMSWWKKSLLAIWWVGVWWGIWKNRDKIAETLWISKKLSFEDSLVKVQWDMNWLSSSEQWLKTGFDGIKYNESTSEIESFGSKTKIDKSKKQIPGMSATFSDYSQLIFTANIINSLKHNYEWKWDNKSPFSIDRWWDLIMKTRDSGKEKDVKVLSWGMWSTLAKYVPDVDWSFFKKAFSLFGGNNDGKQKLAIYLNGLPLWEAWSVPVDASPALKSWTTVQEAIVAKNPKQELWQVRWPIETRHIGDNKYDVISWNNHTVLEKLDSGLFCVQGLNIVLPESEAIRVANFINKMKKEYSNQGKTNTPFSYEWEWAHRWIWFEPKKSPNYSSSKIRTLTRSSLEETMPTLYKTRDNIDLFVAYLNGLKNNEWRSLR
jgi:hypothetical protein